jgi:hypothetical protein
MDFETKLAAAGETLEKLAAERGLSLNDFTEQETVDLLTTIMGEGGAKVADVTDEGAHYLPELLPFGSSYVGMQRGAKAGRPLEGALRGFAGGTAGGILGGIPGTALRMAMRDSVPAQMLGGAAQFAGSLAGGAHGTDLATRGLLQDAEKQKRLQAFEEAAAAAKQASLTYGEVMHEVAKVAAANGYDISQASPAELDDAVQKMAALLSDPEYLTKQAALQEKIAEADAMGRVMAHAYVDELGKLAAAEQEKSEEDEKEDEKEKAEKKASFYRSVKSAGEMPAALKEHMKKKDDEEDEDEEEKKASFAKAASLRAAELLILNGVNPETGYKFASQQEALDAGAALVLQSKGYI